MSRTELNRALESYRARPLDDPFCKLLSSHQLTLFLRTIHESNRIEDVGPESEEGTQRLVNDLAFHILEFFRTLIHQVDEGTWRLRDEEVAAVEALSSEQEEISSLLHFSQKLTDELSAYLAAHRLSLDQADPVAIHTIVFMSAVFANRLSAIATRAVHARHAMLGREIPQSQLRQIGTWDQAVCIHHAALMARFLPAAEVGQWKTKANHLPGGPILYAPEDVPAAMQRWGQVLQQALLECLVEGRDAIEVAAWASYSLLLIHPFSDGNGRIARLMTNIILIGFADIPFPVLLANGGEQKAIKRYYAALRKIDNSHLSLFSSTDAERRRALAPLVRLIEGSILDTLKQIDNQARDLYPDYQPLFDSP